jgi:Ca-activated chloride channel homolog
MMRPLNLLRNRSDLVAFVATLLVGSLLVAGAKAAWPADRCGPAAVAAQDQPQLGSQSIRVTVLSSSNKDGVMKEMACRFEDAGPTLDGTAIDVVVTSEASGAAFESIGDPDLRPTVWSPAATSWVNMLRRVHEDWVPPPSEISSIATSPQVIAMPRTIAQDPAFNWPDGSLGWSDIVKYATDPNAWSAISHGRWGSFKLGKTNPRLSTSGLNSTVATFAEITQTSPSALTTQQISDPRVLSEVHKVEEATVHYAPTSVDFLSNLRAQDDAGTGESYVSAVLLEEKSVWDYNQGNPSGDPTTLGVNPPPATPLVAFYPDGGLVADHPFVVLKSAWVTDDQRMAAGKFRDFLLAGPQQQRFQQLGFRNADGEAGPEISVQSGLLPQEGTSSVPLPDGAVLQAIRDRWRDYRKQARVLLVMDVSSSMLNPAVAGSNLSKLDLEKAAALGAIDQLGPHDEVGLWTYGSSAASRPGQPYAEVVPLGRVSQTGESLRDAIRGLTADTGNGGELYDATAAAVSELRKQIAANTDKINGIVLVSDGPDVGSIATREQLVNEVAPPLQDQQEVRLFTIAFGDNADTAALSDLAHASLGTPYDATDPSKIGKVFYQVVANF